jgi:hypothetical protein
MAKHDDAAKASRRKPRKGRRLKPRADQAFAELIEPEEFELTDAQDLEDGDLEFADGPGGLQTGTFTQQYYLRTLPVEEDAIAAFAHEFAIEHLEVLRAVLALIHEELDVAEPETGWVMLWRGGAWDVPEAYAAAHQRAVEHADGLLALLSGPFWPVALDQEPERGRRALLRYRRWLAEFRFGRRVRGRRRPPWAQQQAAAHVLASHWSLLTDEEPSVVHRNDATRPDKPLNAFTDAYFRVCGLFRLHPPTTKALETWLNAKVEDRAAYHAEFNRLFGDD